MSLSIKLITDLDAFHDLKDSWQALLDKSDANSLFMGWAWQYCWWNTWHSELAIDLQLIVVQDGDELVGILPLFSDQYKPRFSLSRRRIQFIGNHWLATPTVRTEYVGPIIASEQLEKVCTELAHFLTTELVWDEFIVCDSSTNNDKAISTLREKLNNITRIHKVVQSESTGYAINTSGNIDEYKPNLGRNTRKKYFNDIKKLAKNEMQYCQYEGNADSFIEELNEFHKTRWGKPVFAGAALKFHLSLMEKLQIPESNSLTAIKHEDKNIAVLYNIVSNNAVYNIQAGFLEKAIANLALGKVHLGQSIEETFANPQAESFDLLAGEGKNTDYKSHLSGEKIHFETFSLTGNKRVWLNYKFVDLMRTFKSLVLSR